MKKLFILLVSIVLWSCSKDNDTPVTLEEPATFSEIGSLDIGGEAAAEISAYDPKTQRLFVVNNSETHKIDVIDLQDPSQIKVINSIDVSASGGVNSVAVHDGKLAAAIEADNQQSDGKVVVYNTSDYSIIHSISVGALPDMVIFSPDGKYILTANEGQPSNDYLNDPNGTVSIISVHQNYQVKTIDFSAFSGSQKALEQKGLNISGLNASFTQDIEPEYIAISPDSKTAWITLQENNAIAKLDLTSKRFTAIFPLGYKNYSEADNAVDFSNKDELIQFKNHPVKGMYQPDAIAVLEKNGTPFLLTANEGDAREYDAFEEEDKIKNLNLDPQKFPSASTLQLEKNLGSLKITTTKGDIDYDGDYDNLYTFGGRSFSVWNGNTGNLIYDSKNQLGRISVEANIYDDGRSENKGVEPEGITTGSINGRETAFVGLERADAIAIYDINNPENPVFLQLLKCGDAPEGVLFISAKDSPTQKSLLVVSSEGDGVVKVYQSGH